MSLDQKHNPESLDTEPARSLLPPLQFDPRLIDGDDELSERFASQLQDATESALKINADRQDPLPEEVVIAAVMMGFDSRIERASAAADRFYGSAHLSDFTKRLHGLHEFSGFGSAAKHFIENEQLDDMDLGAQVYDEAEPGLDSGIKSQLIKYFVTIKEIPEPRIYMLDTTPVDGFPEFGVVMSSGQTAESKYNKYRITSDRVWVRQVATDPETGLAEYQTTPIMESISVQRVTLSRRRALGAVAGRIPELTIYDYDDVYDS